MQAEEFRDELKSRADVLVFGVSPDPVKSHRKFASELDLNFPILADTEKELSQACGVWVEKSMYGKKYMGIERSTFVIDKDGIIVSEMRKVKPEGNAADSIALARPS